VLHRVRSIEGDVLVFSSSHYLRVLAAHWLGLQPAGRRYLFRNTASLCIYASSRHRDAHTLDT
jgi:probable phosphoglycerate mutase